VARIDEFGPNTGEPKPTVPVDVTASELAAAAKLGLRTAHVARSHEHGPNKGETAPTVTVDYAAKNLADLADQLGV
jgi:2-haloacid dehalogenase